MSTAEHDNVIELETQNLTALIELQRSKFRAEGGSPMPHGLIA
jgi:hypothetical protein